MELLFINLGTSEIFIVLMLFTAGLAPLVLAILALIDLFRRDFGQKSTDKILLIALIVLAPFIGSLIYLLALKKNYPLKRQLM